MTAVDEKKTVVDNGSSDELEQGSSSAGYSEIDTKKLIRKIDLVLIPWLALLYLYAPVYAICGMCESLTIAD
jgi:hypothetical protein